jgi:regulator of sigma E protease
VFDMILTLLAFLLTLAILIVVHEYGHYRVAVACNVKVLRFSIGFGRVIFTRRFGPDRAEFAVSALPLGGYVRMLDEREDEVPPAERERSFNRRPLWQRTAIVAAGPIANLLLAVVLYAAAQWFGVQEPKAVLSAPIAGSIAERAGLRSADWVREWSTDGATWQDIESMSDLRWRATRAALDSQALHLVVTDKEGGRRRVLVLDTGAVDARDVDAKLMTRLGIGAPYSDPVLGDIIADGPAARAGLLKGDRVLSTDGVAVEDAQSLRERIRRAVDGDRPVAMRWTIERAAQVRDIIVTPRVVAGAGEGDPALGRIDAYIGQPAESVLVRQGALDGLVTGVSKTWEMSALTVKMIGRMLIGEASVRNLSGPLTIADYAGQSVQQGLAYYLAFLALVSVSLGVLNLLPLPMLDGGHLMYYLFEWVTGRPVPDRWLERLQRGGIAVLLVMMSVALFNDVARLLGLH